MTEARTEVAVVGGGIAGLAAAHTLAKRGVPFLLLEATSRWGGVIRTERVGGFLLEGGPDAILTAKPDALALCRELGLLERLVPTNPDVRTVYVLHRARLHPLPEGMLGIPTRLMPFLKSGLFSWGGKLRMGLDLVIPRRRRSGDESIASFIRRRFGGEAALRLADPLLAGIHSGDAERLSIQATFPRLAEMEARHGSVIRALLAAKASAAGSGSAPAFCSLAAGLGELVDALVSALPAECLRTGSPVVSVSRETERFVLGIEGGGTLVSRALVLALPAPRAASLLASLAPEISRALSRIPFAHSATVVLGCRLEDVGHPLDGYGIVVTRTEGLRTTACSFFSTKFPGRAPEGHVLLRAFLGGVRDPDVLGLEDADLIATVEREMGPVLRLTGPPVLSRVYRWPSGTPQMEVGHLERMAEVERRLASLPGLFLTGAGLRGTGLPDTIADGSRTAEAACAGLATV